ncbi:MAG TPA: DUF951 domain-containing protein [bacterium]|nr:DUF951 domain-containing protein [bacterium]
MIRDFQIDDLVTMKKKHPCGGYDWKIIRLGADIGLVCTTCQHKILLPRAKLETRIKTIQSTRSNTSL